MAIAKLSLIEHLKSPFTFKTPEGKTARLIRSERITAIALFILGLSLAIVGGPLIFYTYTGILKNKRYQKLEQEHQIQLRLANMSPLEKAGRLIPELANKCALVKPLGAKVATLLDQCKKAKDEVSQRLQLLELGRALKEFKTINKEIDDRTTRYIGEKQGNVAQVLEICKAKEELKPYEFQVDYAYSDMSALIDKLPLNARNREEEVKLLKNVPAGLQLSRFQKLLESQFIRHSVGGDGACGAHSLALGIWPHLLELRKTNYAEAMREEHRYALHLRNEIVDWMEHNVNNVIHNEKNPQNKIRNSDGSEPMDFRAFCIELPGPEARVIQEVTWDEYLAAMRQPYAWFGNSELTAAAGKYHVCIHTYKADSVDVVNNRLQPIDECMFGKEHKKVPIDVYHNGGHYEIMTPLALTSRVGLPKPAGAQR